MKKKFIWGLAILTFLCLVKVYVYAETNSDENLDFDKLDYSYGKIVKVSKTSLILKEEIAYADKTVEKEIEYVFLPKTEFENVRSAADLKKGDFVDLEFILKNGKRQIVTISQENYFEQLMTKTPSELEKNTKNSKAKTSKNNYKVPEDDGSDNYEEY